MKRGYLVGRYWTALKAIHLICLLCLSVTVFYSNVDPFMNLRDPDIDIDISRLNRSTNTNLRIIVLTFNRCFSLKRLLHSLNNAYFDNDTIVLEIWLDRSINGELDIQTLYEARKFQFKKGTKVIYIHDKHVGIYGQWMGTWQPNYFTDEIAVIFEDDTSVSPFFYRYLKLVHKKYNNYESINGFSLQVNVKHGSEDGQLNVSAQNIVFLYPVIGTSGFSPKRNNWIKFIRWYSLKGKNTILPLVPEIKKPTGWYIDFLFQDRTSSMWEMWHIYFAFHHKEWTLYPNFGYNLALTINWKEKGLHFDGKNKGYDEIRLVEKWDHRFYNLPKYPAYINTNGIQI